VSTEPDATRIVRSWLRTDEHDFPVDVIDDVLALLDATRQDRPFWPARRFAAMNRYAKLAIAAAAVVVVAFVAIRFLPAIGVGGPDLTPSPAPSATTVPTPSTKAAAFPPSGELEIGQHSITQEGVTYTFSISTSGWISNGTFGIDKAAGSIGPEGAGFIFWTETPVGVFANPCAQTRGPNLGSSAVDLAAAVATVPGTDLVSGPTDVTVGGHPAKKVVLTVREDVGCGASSFYLWCAPSAGLARFATELGSMINVWIIEVDGTLIWIDGETFKGAGPEPGRQIQEIIDSIQFE
jgi:hypothetical protein